jgi:ribosomal protein S14
MLIQSNTISSSKNQNRCLSCGTTENINKRKYCSIKCRQNLRQKLNARSGLLLALNANYATFYFSDTMIIMDIVLAGSKEIFRFSQERVSGQKPAEEFGKMANMLGRAWWAEEQRSKKKYLASRHVLNLADKHLAIGSVRPKLVKLPTISLEMLQYLGMKKDDLNSSKLFKTIKSSYRQQAKIHHPDLGGQASRFRKIHVAYKELLRWAQNPRFTKRRGFPDKWFYDGETKKWVQPITLKDK